MRFLGIDPGMSGGIAELNEQGEILSVDKFGDKTEADIFNLFSDYNHEPSLACIENVHSMPRQGVASSFKFGRNFGLLLGCLYGAKIPFGLVSPQKWQKIMGCLSRGDKNVTKAAAQRLWPKTRITHAIADALLIAEYCRRDFRTRQPLEGIHDNVYMWTSVGSALLNKK